MAPGASCILMRFYARALSAADCSSSREGQERWHAWVRAGRLGGAHADAEVACDGSACGAWARIAEEWGLLTSWTVVGWRIILGRQRPLVGRRLVGILLERMYLTAQGTIVGRRSRNRRPTMVDSNKLRLLLLHVATFLFRCVVP